LPPTAGHSRAALAQFRRPCAELSAGRALALAGAPRTSVGRHAWLTFGGVRRVGQSAFSCVWVVFRPSVATSCRNLARLIFVDHFRLSPDLSRHETRVHAHPSDGRDDANPMGRKAADLAAMELEAPRRALVDFRCARIENSHLVPRIVGPERSESLAPGALAVIHLLRRPTDLQSHRNHIPPRSSTPPCPRFFAPPPMLEIRHLPISIRWAMPRRWWLRYLGRSWSSTV
jgi:hypothetical protein